MKIAELNVVSPEFAIPQELLKGLDTKIQVKKPLALKRRP
jgi:hypothetical protein